MLWSIYSCFIIFGTFIYFTLCVTSKIIKIIFLKKNQSKITSKEKDKTKIINEGSNNERLDKKKAKIKRDYLHKIDIQLKQERQQLT